MCDGEFEETKIFEQFQVKYSSLLGKILSEQEDCEDKTALGLFFYYIVKELLVSKFQIGSSLDNLTITPTVILTNKSYSKLKENITQQVHFELLNHFTCNLSESEPNESQITPYIFSLIFEESLQKDAKQKAGVFYTSSAEVAFMCKESLIHYLRENTELPIRKITALVYESKTTNLTPKEIATLKKRLMTLRIIDPACGAGAFIIGFTQLLYTLFYEFAKRETDSSNPATILNRIIQYNVVGMDINSEALSVAHLRLFCLSYALNSEKTPRSNLWEINALTESLEERDFSMEFKFDIVIGNPPYIRQEQFTKETSTSVSKDYKAKIMSFLEALLDYKIIFPRNLKSDFYIFFFYRALSLLKENGVLCFITSNSWLDAKFGYKFREVLLENFTIKAIFSNKVTKSFSSAVNSVISIFIRKLDSELCLHNETQFITLNKSYSDVNHHHQLLNQIHDSHDYTSDEMNISHILQRTLIENLQDKTLFKNKWGSYYFRAPAILKTILESNSEKIVPLESIGTIRYPLKTGLNDFFIIDKEKQLQFNIEPEFLVTLLKSPKKITSLLITKSSLEKSLFICIKPKEELLQEGKMGALNYITWGEQQTTYAKQQTREGIGWSEVPSVKNHRPYWYSLYHIPYVDIFCNRFFDRRFFFCYTKEDILEDQTFYGLILHKEFKKKLMVILAILNSTLSYFMLEFFGRTTLGKGALQFTVNDFKILPILNISKMPKELCSKLELRFKQILSRDIKTIFDEIKEKDRQELDALIFQWLNLTPDQIDQVYTAFIELTSARLMKSGQSIT